MRSLFSEEAMRNLFLGLLFTLLVVVLFAGCESPAPTPSPPQGEHSILTPGCKDGTCTVPELATEKVDCACGDCECVEPTRFGRDCPDCFRSPPAKPEPTPPFSFAPEPEDKPAPSPEVTVPEPEKEGMNVDLIIGLAAFVAGMIGAYVASNNDDDPSNDMDARQLVKDVVARIQKVKA